MLLDAIKSILGASRSKAPDSSHAASADGGAPAQPSPRAPDDAPSIDPVHLAACVLLLDVAHADGEFTAAERSHLEETMGRHFAIAPDTVHALIAAAEEERGRAIDHFRYTNVLHQSYDVGQKMVLAEVMWGLVLADGSVDEHEHYLTRKISNLLSLEPGYLSTAKQRAAARVAGM